ncbi:MAG: transcription termination/antitermination protein NusG [Patescibacteria group bacterium]
MFLCFSEINMEINKEKQIPEENSTSQEATSNRHWYAVHTYSGYEDAVARYLKQRVSSLAMQDRIFDVIVPKEKKIKIKNGQRRTVEEKIYPGYVLVDMVMTEDTWYVVRNTPRVTRFVGAETTKPVPLSHNEVESLLARMNRDETRFKIEFNIDDPVKIIDGPFKDYDGKISEIDQERGKVKVLVQIFGRDTAVELDLLQVAKL